MKSIALLIVVTGSFLALFCVSCGVVPGGEPMLSQAPAIIPAPEQMEVRRGSFAVDASSRILITPDDAEMRSVSGFLVDAVRVATTLSLPVESIGGRAGRSGDLQLIRDPSRTDLGAEGYELKGSPESVALKAATSAGLFYGVQTIRQLLPLSGQGSATLPCVEITDRPRFPWRGMLLDCGRHFMSKDFVQQTIDLLAYHKMNTLHWHLTEDQGWRIEIKGYPKLTEVGAWRTLPDETRYGGFYTQEDIREVVEYARQRHVRVVPEIEMPGHSVASLAAYPEHSCTGGPFAVETSWGVHQDVYCAGKEATFEFLEDVLTEVIAMFPGAYVHVGGDECPKDRWKACPDCQARIATEGLADEHELQSWFIRRIEQFLLSKDRRLIGWDEILEGGLAPGATVQSWRGMDGAIAAAKSGHDAIVSPTSHAYFDADIGNIDLRRVYSFEPIPPGLDAAEARHILGGECNMWTERAPQESVHSKVFPRLLAMAERLWSPKSRDDYLEFHGRVQSHYARLDRLGVTYGPESRPVSILPKFDRNKGVFEVGIEAGEEGLELRYTTDATTWREYAGGLTFDETTLLRARAFRNGKPYGAESSQQLIMHAGTGKSVDLEHAYSPKYTAGGPSGLVDGIRGSSRFRDGRWQGFEGEDLVGTVDLGEVGPIRAVRVGLLQDNGSWIFYPPQVEISVSNDGSEFRRVALIENDVPAKQTGALTKEVSRDFTGLSARYVRVRATNLGTCPAWHPGAGGPAWVFADEIVIDR